MSFAYVTDLGRLICCYDKLFVIWKFVIVVVKTNFVCYHHCEINHTFVFELKLHPCWKIPSSSERDSEREGICITLAIQMHHIKEVTFHMSLWVIFNAFEIVLK